jgi:hypothetical protein
MQTLARPTAGLGHADGDAENSAVPRLNPPRTALTVWKIRASVRQPDPLADGVCVIPEHEPAAPPNALSLGSALGTACLAPWRAASATVVVAQSTRNRSIVMASMKNRNGKTSANSTSAWPRLLLNNTVSTPSAGRR